MKEKLKQNFPIYIFVLLLLIGIAIMYYPVISNFFATKYQKQVIASYQKITATNNKSKISSMINEAKQYNEKLTTTTVTDMFINPQEESSKEYLNILNTGRDGVIGYIEIPKIKEEIPIYHGTSTKTLQKGVGHLEGSSFPVGGENTHAVLSAHRGLPSAKLFTDLDQLKKGDKFYIHILDETLAYMVEEINIIDPSDTEKLSLKEGKDYITLVTCHPYAINTHRLLVRGVRVGYHEEKEEKIAQAGAGTSSIILKEGLVFASAIIISMMIFIIRINLDQQKTKKEEIEVI